MLQQPRKDIRLGRQATVIAFDSAIRRWLWLFLYAHKSIIIRRTSYSQRVSKAGAAAAPSSPSMPPLVLSRQDSPTSAVVGRAPIQKLQHQLEKDPVVVLLAWASMSNRYLARLKPPGLVWLSRTHCRTPRDYVHHLLPFFAIVRTISILAPRSHTSHRLS